ncbi:MAG: hypothetical protein WCG06_05485 [Candidatus Omnitrophota bacterium]
MRIRTALVTTAVLVGLVGARPLAAADTGFYGVKMSSEAYARDMLQNKDFKLTAGAFADNPSIDKSVYATANFKNTIHTGRALEVTVFNHSKREIGAKYQFNEFTLVFKDGTREEFTDSGFVFYPNVEKILPGTSVRYCVGLNGLEFRKSDIEMIVCSFNLDETRIVLLPLPQSAPVLMPYQAITERLRPVSSAPKMAPKAESVIGKKVLTPIPKPYQAIVEHVRPVTPVPRVASKTEPVTAVRPQGSIPKPYQPIVEHVRPAVVTESAPTVGIVIGKAIPAKRQAVGGNGGYLLQNQTGQSRDRSVAPGA